MNTNESKTAPAAEALWTVKDVADYLRVSTRWVYLRASEGTLPSLKFGSAVRFEPAAVRAFARGEPAAKGRVLRLFE
jgi:excisionase family DNA binding protein